MRRRDFLGLAGTGLAGLRWPPDMYPADTARPGSADPGAPGQADPRFDEISSLVERTMADYRVTGVALGISKGDAIALRGFGLTNVDNPQPVTPDTVFPIASISKTVVATAVLRLHDEGRLDVDDRVVDHLPDFRIASEEATAEVRIAHLLTHTPGWEGQLGTPDRGADTLAHFVTTMRGNPALAAPGEVWSYNNAGWGVAGRILEVVTERSIHDALEELVFAPLGLERAFSRTGEAMTYRFAAPHRERDGRTVVPRPFQLPANVAAGGCAMSLESLIRYARFHLGDGSAPNGSRLLSARSLLAMRTPRLTKNGSTDEMGLGWHLRTLDGVRTAQHGGTLGGHCLHVQLVPERDLCFAVLTNHGDGWRLNEEVAAAILDRYEGLALGPNQRTGGNRGGNERMHLHAVPLEPQPALEEYVGLYERPPVGDVAVRMRDDRLAIGSGERSYGLVFWAPDMAYSTGPGAFEGMAVEFVRDAAGAVRWVRVNGRIARRVES